MAAPGGPRNVPRCTWYSHLVYGPIEQMGSMNGSPVTECCPRDLKVVALLEIIKRHDTYGVDIGSSTMRASDLAAPSIKIYDLIANQIGQPRPDAGRRMHLYRQAHRNEIEITCSRGLFSLTKKAHTHLVCWVRLAQYAEVPLVGQGWSWQRLPDNSTCTLCHGDQISLKAWNGPGTVFFRFSILPRPKGRPEACVGVEPMPGL